MSKTMFDTTLGGIIMGSPIEKAKKVYNDRMKETTNIDELIDTTWDKEEVNENSIINIEVNDVKFIAHNSYNPNWKNKGDAPCRSSSRCI